MMHFVFVVYTDFTLPIGLFCSPEQAHLWVDAYNDREEREGKAFVLKQDGGHLDPMEVK